MSTYNPKFNNNNNDNNIHEVFFMLFLFLNGISVGNGIKIARDGISQSDIVPLLLTIGVATYTAKRMIDIKRNQNNQNQR